MPGVYHQQLVRDGIEPSSPNHDTYCLGIMRRYQSLMPLAQEARKPMFFLKPADGAIGGHAQAVMACYADFRDLAREIAKRAGVTLPR